MYDRKIILHLTEDEWNALCTDAKLSDRTPKLQARYILKTALAQTLEALNISLSRIKETEQP